jgi:hypothetical protein
MDTPEKLTRNGTQEKLKQKHNADSTKKQGLSQVLTKGQRRRYDLNCKSANVVYRLECILCRLVYVGETKGKLHKRYAVIDPVSLTMLTILFTSILINLTTPHVPPC